MTEKELANIVLETHPFVFRNDCGCGYVGGTAVMDKKNRLVIISPKRIRYGLQPGSGDYVGWTTVTVTPDMVGKKIAIFTSCEIKTKNDRMSDDQKNWHRVVKDSGGISEIWTEEGIKDD